MLCWVLLLEHFIIEFGHLFGDFTLMVCHYTSEFSLAKWSVGLFLSVNTVCGLAVTKECLSLYSANIGARYCWMIGILRWQRHFVYLCDMLKGFPLLRTLPPGTSPSLPLLVVFNPSFSSFKLKLNNLSRVPNRMNCMFFP